VFLDAGHYEFSGLARTDAVERGTGGKSGALLRKSGERSIAGITIAAEWKRMAYEFTVRGIENVELVCEFRGRGSAYFDPESLQLNRKELLSEKP
jgi:hypothetical protein